MANVSSAPAFPKDLDRAVSALRLKPAYWIVSDEYNHRVWLLQPNTEPRQLMPTLEGEAQFHYPTAVACVNNEIFVVDSWHHRIIVFDLNGKPLRAFGQYGNEPEAFACPEGIWATRDGELMIADTQNDRIKVYQTDGTLKKVIEKAAFQLDERGFSQGQSSTVKSGDIFNPRQVCCDAHGEDFVVKTNDRLLLFQQDQCVATITSDDFVLMHCLHFDGKRVLLFHEQRREVAAYHWDRPITYILNQGQQADLVPVVEGDSCIWLGPEGEREVVLQAPQTHHNPVSLLQDEGRYIRFSSAIYDREWQAKSSTSSKLAWSDFQPLLEAIKNHAALLRKPTSASLATHFPLHQPLPNYLFESAGLLIKTQWEHLLAMLFAQLQADCDHSEWQSLHNAGSQALFDLFEELIGADESFAKPHYYLNLDVALTLLFRLLALTQQRAQNINPIATQALLTQLLTQASDPALPSDQIHGLKQQATYLSQHLIGAASMDFRTELSQAEKAARSIVNLYRTYWYQHLKCDAEVSHNYVIGNSLYHFFPFCYAAGFTDIDRTTIDTFLQQPLVETETARTYIASHLVHLGDIEKAIQVQEDESRQITKHNTKPTLVGLYTRFGQKEKAEAVLAEMKGDDHLKAQIAFAIFTDACQQQLESLLQEVEKSPNKTWVYNWIGYLFVFAGRFSDGLAWLESHADRTQGGFFDEYRALCAWFSGQPDKAKSYFEAGTKRNFKVNLLQASCYRAHGEPDAARAALDRFRQVLPSWFADLHEMLVDLSTGDDAAFQDKQKQLPACAHVFYNKRWIGANQAAFEQQLRAFLEFEKQLTLTKGQAGQGQANLLRNYCFMLTNNVFLPV